MSTINQCQGCQAGWPTEIKTFKHKIDGETTTLFVTQHIVKGGYKGERIICDKDRYVLLEETK